MEYVLLNDGYSGQLLQSTFLSLSFVSRYDNPTLIDQP